MPLTLPRVDRTMLALFAGERLVRLEIGTANQYGETKIAGEALVALV